MVPDSTNSKFSKVEGSNGVKRRHTLAENNVQSATTDQQDYLKGSRKRRATDNLWREIPGTPERTARNRNTPPSPSSHKTHLSAASTQTSTPDHQWRRPPSLDSEFNKSNTESPNISESRVEEEEATFKSSQDEFWASSQLMNDLTEFTSWVPGNPSQQVHNVADNKDNEDCDTSRLDSWIESRLRSGKADNEMQIITALQCTSMDPNLADQVLASLVAGKGIPPNTRGVWTAEDDKDAEGTDARGIMRVEEKHGDLFDARFDYLNTLRKVESER